MVYFLTLSPGALVHPPYPASRTDHGFLESFLRAREVSTQTIHGHFAFNLRYHHLDLVFFTDLINLQGTDG